MLSYRVIGKHLKDARDRLKMGQADVAQKADISVAYYGKIERGDIRPNLDRLADVCEVLGIPIQDIFLGARVETSELFNAEQIDAAFINHFMDLAANTDRATKQLIIKVSQDIANHSAEK